MELKKMMNIIKTDYKINLEKDTNDLQWLITLYKNHSTLLKFSTNKAQAHN